MPADLLPPPADPTVGYLMHISETIGRVEGMLVTQNQVTRDLIVRVDSHDVRLNAAESTLTGHEQRLSGIEAVRKAEGQQAAEHEQASRAHRRQLRLLLIGQGCALAAGALWKLWDAVGSHLLH